MHITFQPVLIGEYALAFPAFAGPSAPPLALILQFRNAPGTNYRRHVHDRGSRVYFFMSAYLNAALDSVPLLMYNLLRRLIDSLLPKFILIISRIIRFVTK